MLLGHLPIREKLYPNDPRTNSPSVMGILIQYMQWLVFGNFSIIKEV